MSLCVYIQPTHLAVVCLICSVYTYTQEVLVLFEVVNITSNHSIHLFFWQILLSVLLATEDVRIFALTQSVVLNAAAILDSNWTAMDSTAVVSTLHKPILLSDICVYTSCAVSLCV